jgi:hypothetical protein
MLKFKGIEDPSEKRFSRKTPGPKSSYPWHINLVPEFIEVDDKNYPHPARDSAIFLVHGIGQQNQMQTAAHLRSGFEDALSKIIRWQVKNGVKRISDDLYLPPPFIREGYWADYQDIEVTFKEDWDNFGNEDRDYFKNIWKIRILSLFRTYSWFLLQQIRLLHPRVIKDVKIWAWLTYWPLQITSLFGLTLALVRFPKIVSGFLADVRLYLRPRGITERTIVERIDFRVRKKFMQMIGLDWDFRPLRNDNELIHASGTPLKFKHIIWVAHSLGTVISYNVLSDLFHDALELEKKSEKKGEIDEEQLKGISIFKGSLFRFITLGSPLDKVAYLFAKSALRPWPDVPRQNLLENGEGEIKKEWWVNFYHVFDPVSGSLESPLICGNEPPINEHIGLFGLKYLPGLAHLAYWKDLDTLRFILGRTYGRNVLQDKIPKRKPAFLLGLIAILFKILQILLAAGIIYILLNWKETIDLIKTIGSLGGSQ